MTAGYFVTGTDTGCGKTEVSLALVRLWRDRGERVTVFKPVAAGAWSTPGGLRNDDAERLLAASNVAASYAEINPFVFAPAIAPHIAAELAGRKIELDSIAGAFSRLCRRADRVIVEGAGGWRVPLGDDWDMSDLARHLALPVILVVGLRLGCLNHALLSVESVRRSGLDLAGWVGNRVEPDMAAVTENLATLERRIHAPCLGVIPHLAPPIEAQEVAHYLSLPRVLQAD